MEDWTDIFAEELKEIEVSLPADDWDVVQQKYTAAQEGSCVVVDRRGCICCGGVGRRDIPVP